MTRIPLTLCLVHDIKNERVLLGMKKKGFGAGRFNGFGGKIEVGESIEEAAKREVREEAGIIVSEIEKMGVLDFEFDAKPGEILEVHIYRSHFWEGDHSESDEMIPQWFGTREIPLHNMWPDDRYWLPLFLKNKKFTGRFLFGPKDSVLEYTLRVVG
jgi:8-oxo-dGTP diphosphatase/2-hydroxy-dATP diphosphatase